MIELQSDSSGTGFQILLTDKAAVKQASQERQRTVWYKKWGVETLKRYPPPRSPNRCCFGAADTCLSSHNQYIIFFLLINLYITITLL